MPGPLGAREDEDLSVPLLAPLGLQKMQKVAASFADREQALENRTPSTSHATRKPQGQAGPEWERQQVFWLL